MPAPQQDTSRSCGMWVAIRNARFTPLLGSEPPPACPGQLARRSAARKQLATADGLVGYTLRARPLARDYWTLSVWQDNRALREFMRTPPHVQLMAPLKPGMGPTKFVTWKISAADGQTSMAEALEHLASGVALAFGPARPAVLRHRGSAHSADSRLLASAATPASQRRRRAVPAVTERQRALPRRCPRRRRRGHNPDTEPQHQRRVLGRGQHRTRRPGTGSAPPNRAQITLICTPRLTTPKRIAAAPNGG